MFPPLIVRSDRSAMVRPLSSIKRLSARRRITSPPVASTATMRPMRPKKAWLRSPKYRGHGQFMPCNPAMRQRASGHGVTMMRETCLHRLHHKPWSIRHENFSIMSRPPIQNTAVKLPAFTRTKKCDDSSSRACNNSQHSELSNKASTVPHGCMCNDSKRGSSFSVTRRPLATSWGDGKGHAQAGQASTAQFALIQVLWSAMLPSTPCFVPFPPGMHA